MTTTSQDPTTSLRTVLETFAGYHTPPQTGTKALPFGACAAKAHDRCPEHTKMGATTLICDCSCHEAMDPADFDAAYGAPWWVEVEEGE